MHISIMEVGYKNRSEDDEDCHGCIPRFLRDIHHHFSEIEGHTVSIFSFVS
jgi:hypothetical protein